MTKAIILIVCGLSLLGCSKLRDYDLSVEPPNRKERSYDEPYSSHATERVLNSH